MRWTTRGVALGLIGAAAVIVTVAGVCPVDTRSDTAGPIGAGMPAESESATVAPDSVIDRPIITLGPLAPIDPCTVISWADLPAEVRPVFDSPPSRWPPGPGDDFTVGCRFDNPTANPGGPMVHGGSATVTITWGVGPPQSLAPAGIPHATTATFGLRKGLQHVETDTSGHPVCIGLMPAAGGIAGAEVTTTRIPAIDICAVVSAALSTIAAHTS